MTGQRYPIFLRIRKSVLKIHSERLQKNWFYSSLLQQLVDSYLQIFLPVPSPELDGRPGYRGWLSHCNRTPDSSILVDWLSLSKSYHCREKNAKRTSTSRISLFGGSWSSSRFHLTGYCFLHIPPLSLAFPVAKQDCWGSVCLGIRKDCLSTGGPNLWRKEVFFCDADLGAGAESALIVTSALCAWDAHIAVIFWWNSRKLGPIRLVH